MNANPELRFIENAFVDVLRQGSASVTVNARSAANAIEFEIQPTTTQVGYDEVSGTGLFRSRQISRSVSLGLSARITRKTDGRLLFAGVRQSEYRDTIDVKNVETVESVSVGISHAQLPPGGFFDRFIEPVVILVTSGVLLYLLFTVRS